MGLGSTAKKLQQLADVAEKLYAKVNEVLERIADLRDRMEETGDRVDAIERELEEQRAIVVALAEREGVDVESVVADVGVPTGGEDTGGGESDGTASDADGADGDGRPPGADDGEPADASPSIE